MLSPRRDVMYGSGRRVDGKFVQGALHSSAGSGLRQVEALPLQQGTPISQGYVMQAQSQGSQYGMVHNTTFDLDNMVYNPKTKQYKAEYHPHDHPKLVQMVPRMVPVVMASPPSVMASPPTRPAAPPEIVQEKHEAVTIEREVPVFNEISVQSEKLVEKFEEVQVDRIRFEDTYVNVDRVNVVEQPVVIEKLVVKEVRVPFDVEIENITYRDVVTEVPVESVVLNEVEVPVERIVIKEVPVPIERIVEKTVVKDVMVERIVVKEIPVPIEKIIVRDVPVPVENIVEKIVEKPVERIIHQERIVHQDKIVYQDRIVEVPVERVVYRPPPREVMEYSGGAYAAGNFSTGGLQGMQRKVRRIGLGVVLQRNTDGTTFVQDVVPGFAAAVSEQVKSGDLIVSVDGTDVSGWDLEDIKQLTVGEEGSSCRLVLRRRNEQHTVSLRRSSPSLSGSYSAPAPASTQNHQVNLA